MNDLQDSSTNALDLICIIHCNAASWQQISYVHLVVLSLLLLSLRDDYSEPIDSLWLNSISCEITEIWALYNIRVLDTDGLKKRLATY